MSGQTTTPIHIRVRGACTWAACEAGCVDMTMRLHPTAPKPLAAACPLCARELQILSAAPIPPTPEASA